MKLSIQLTEQEIQHAIADWYKAKEPENKTLFWQDVSLEIVEADDDPRSPTAAHVVATITIDR